MNFNVKKKLIQIQKFTKILHKNLLLIFHSNISMKFITQNYNKNSNQMKFLLKMKNPQKKKIQKKEELKKLLINIQKLLNIALITLGLKDKIHHKHEGDKTLHIFNQIQEKALISNLSIIMLFKE